MASLAIGPRLEALLKQLPAQGPLLPRIHQTPDSARSAEFCRRCRVQKIRGVSLHSYRYAREGIGVCPSLEEYEQTLRQKIVPFPKAESK